MLASGILKKLKTIIDVPDVLSGLSRNKGGGGVFTSSAVMYNVIISPKHILLCVNDNFGLGN